MPKIFRYPNLLWRPWSVFAYILVVLSIPIWGPIVLVLSFFVSRQSTTKLLRVWFAWVLWIFGTKVEFENKSSYNSKSQCLIISNHQSHFDIPTCFLALDGDIRMAAKKELFMIPVFGQCLAACEFIRVDRQNRKKSRQAAEQIGNAIRDGIQAWVAAEGTRTKDGKLQPFKSGSFSVAIEARIPILPLVVVNGYETFNKSHILPRPGTKIRIVALDFVGVDGLKPNERKVLAEKVHGMMEAELNEQRKRIQNV